MDTTLMHSLRARQAALAALRRKRAYGHPALRAARGLAHVKDAGTVGFADPGGGLVASGIDETRNAARFIITTDSMDREGDVVMASGVMLDNYARNPVVMFAHAEAELFPVGMAEGPDGRLAVDKFSDRVEATVFFHLQTQCSRDCWNLVRRNVLRGVSIGFLPLVAERLRLDKGVDTDGRDRVLQGRYLFRQVDLLEFSIAPIPVQAQALRIELAAGRVKDARLRKALRPYAQQPKSWSPGWTPDAEDVAALDRVEAGLERVELETLVVVSRLEDAMERVEREMVVRQQRALQGART